MLPKPRALLVLIAGALSAAAAAQGRATAGESPFFEELPTVLSASRLPQVLHEAPGAVTILDRDGDGKACDCNPGGSGKNCPTKSKKK